MSGTLAICEIPTELKDELKRFRFNKSHLMNALILKIDRANQRLTVEERLEDCELGELCDELPSQQPRYILISYKLEHADGRKSFPMCLIFYTPSDCSPDVQMLYAGSRNKLLKECELTKSLEVRDVEELTKELLDSKMV
uniref:ADF-H domain-containing protein n=1 Tax=Parascaris univalens TaxID=6257 RepID=A0A915ANK5_PARUN